MKVAKFKKKYFNNKGTTMFEILVSFLVLSIILIIVYKMIAFCGELRMKATDTSMVVNEFSKNICKSDIRNKSADVANVSKEYYETDMDNKPKGPVFYLSVSTETDDSNNYFDGTHVTKDSFADIGYRLKMRNLGAIDLESSDIRVSDYKLVTPRTIQFYYYSYDETTKKWVAEWEK